MSKQPKPTVDERAVALTAFRALPDGRGRQYTATTFPSAPHRGCEWFARQCLAVGWLITPAKAKDGYAVLDVLDEDGDIVADFTIPDRDAFRHIYVRLNLRVEHEDA